MNYQNNSINSSTDNGSTRIIENNLFLFIFSVLLILVMLIGVVGNLLVIYVVLNYGRLKTVTNTYLLHLALSDLVYLSGIPFFVSSMILRAWIFGGFVCKLFFLTQGVNQYTSIIILALLSFDRYLAVCRPNHSIVWRSRVNANLLLLLAWILSFILMIPIIVFTTTISSSPSRRVQCTIDFPSSTPPILYLIYVVYTSTISYVLPLSLMTFFYVKIVRRLRHKVSQQHRRSHTTIRTRRKVSVLVLAVVGVHIFCCAPYWTFQIGTTTELLSQSSSVLILASSITQFLLFVNSSTNPILYAFLSEVFRLSFKRVCYCCLSNGENQYLNEKVVAKRQSSIEKNRDNTNSMKKTKIPLTIIHSNDHADNPDGTNQDLLISNNSTHLTLDNRLLARHSSLAPTISVFSSEVSFTSDM